MSEDQWRSGLKVLPKKGQITSSDRWGVENMKVLPKEERRGEFRSKSAPTRREFVREGEWSSGLKVLDPKERSPKSSRVRGNDDWRESRKTVDHSPRHGRYVEGWNSESLKTLPSPTRKENKDHTDPWRSGLKTISPRWREDREADYSYRSYEPPSWQQPDTQIPAAGSWASENFKVLDNYETKRFQGAHQVGLPRFVRDDYWESGLKTLQEDRPNYEVNGWNCENMKVLDRDRQRRIRRTDNIVVSGTGWDSGLFKTLPSENRIPYAASSDWHSTGKLIPREEQTQRRTIINAGTGWDSGLKTIASPLITWQPSVDHWDVQNGKVLPHYYQSTAGHHKEYLRHIQTPRREDLLGYHERLLRTAYN